MQAKQKVVVITLLFTCFVHPQFTFKKLSQRWSKISPEKSLLMCAGAAGVGLAYYQWKLWKQQELIMQTQQRIQALEKAFDEKKEADAKLLKRICEVCEDDINETRDGINITNVRLDEVHGCIEEWHARLEDLHTKLTARLDGHRDDIDDIGWVLAGENFRDVLDRYAEQIENNQRMPLLGFDYNILVRTYNLLQFRQDSHELSKKLAAKLKKN